VEPGAQTTPAASSKVAEAAAAIGPEAAKPLSAKATADAAAAKLMEPTWIVLPVGGYSPETSVQLGGVAIRYWRLDPQSRPSSLPIVLLGTAKLQIISDIQPELYWDNDTWRWWSELEIQRYPDRFYGIGNDVKESDRESFQRSFGRLRMNLRRRITGAFYGGLATDHQLVDIAKREPDGQLATERLTHSQRQFTGSKGGFTSGLGLSVALDTRDSRSYPTRGVLLDATGIALLHAFGSRYQFASLKLDTRGYLGFGDRQVLAMRYVFHATPGSPPFYMLPELGGPNLLRGYYGGKYRDSVLQAAEAEYRLRLFWRFGAVAFGGIGQVAPSVADITKAPLRPSVGGGIRINLADADIVNLRFDAGYWPGAFGLYFSVLEEF
jgi:outer membrane protein assembly factor BamA